MKKPELYKRTVGILVDAYFKNTLEHSNCYACAVGNIVAATSGIKYEKHSVYGLFYEGCNVMDGTDTVTSYAMDRLIPVNPVLIKQVKATGYTISQLHKIEEAFEDRLMKIGVWDSDDVMFSGLMAVIDVLDEIHENKDSVETEATKKRFCKTQTPELLTNG